MWSSGVTREAGRRWLETIVEARVGLRISADLRDHKNHPTISSVFRRRPHVAECLPRNQKAAPAPVVFSGFSAEVEDCARRRKGWRNGTKKEERMNDETVVLLSN